MTYAPAEDVFTDADARIASAKQLVERFEPIAGTPAETYLTKTRKIPAGAVAGCADLRYLAPPLDGRPPQDHALVSLLRDGDGEISGFQLEFLDIAGARTGTDPGKQTYALREHGVRDGLFHAGGPSDAGYLTEGYSAKALAVAALGLKAYGGGARTILGCAAPPEQTVVIVPDRRPPDTSPDAPAHDRDYRRAVDLLMLAGKTVFVAKAPDCQHPGGGACKDSDDFLRRHGPIRLKALVEDVTSAGLSLDGEARKLAQIEDPLERDAQTKIKAGELKVRVALLRDRVAHYRDAGRAGTAPGDSTSGRKIEFDKLGIAADPVNGAGLLDDLAAAIHRHAFIDECDLVKGVLWTVHGHRRFYDNVQVLPRLVITAGREDSGKTSLAVALAHASDVALVVVSPRPATLYRSIEAHQVALFLDEADVWYPRNEDLREIVNSGFNKDGALVPRTEDVGSGGKREHEVRLYSTFTPMAIVGINLEKVLARTLLSRALIIRMTPAVIGEVTEDIFANPPAVRALRNIASTIKRWVADNERALVAAKPDMPGTINRLKLIWEPLLSIADQAGGDWPRRARAALDAGASRARDPNLGEQLMLDASKVMHDIGVAAIHTKDLIERLLPLEMRSWAAYGRRRVAIRDTEIAELLAPYGLKPEQIKIKGANRRGYRLDGIEAAVARYVNLHTEETSGDRYPATGTGEPQESSDLPAVPQTAGSGLSPLPPESNCEVAVTSELDVTCFSEKNQSGSGVTAVEHPVSEEHIDVEPSSALDGADASTATLECIACGAAFGHDAGKRGRRPAKCPDCRGGGANDRTGISADAAVDQVLAGTRCAYCGGRFRPGETAVEIAGKRYHDACAGSVRCRLAAD